MRTWVAVTALAAREGEEDGGGHHGCVLEGEGGLSREKSVCIVCDVCDRRKVLVLVLRADIIRIFLIFHFIFNVSRINSRFSFDIWVEIGRLMCSSVV